MINNVEYIFMSFSYAFFLEKYIENHYLFSSYFLILCSVLRIHSY